MTIAAAVAQAMTDASTVPAAGGRPAMTGTGTEFDTGSPRVAHATGTTPVAGLTAKFVLRIRADIDVVKCALDSSHDWQFIPLLTAQPWDTGRWSS